MTISKFLTFNTILVIHTT